MRRSRYLLVGLVMLATALATTNIQIHDLKLYVDCEEFYMKAMCYNPVPLGWGNMDANKNGGGGYCSPKLTPFGEWKSACYDSDYFDGSEDVPNRIPAGPPKGWFQALWERDFPILKELGVNTLRLYNANPTTRQASIAGVGNHGIIAPTGNDHLPFMDMAFDWGFKVIFPLMGDGTILSTADEETLKRFLRNQIDEVGNHPALIMYNFGNELGVADNPQLVEKLNFYMDYIHEYQMDKWNRWIPVTCAVVDLPYSYDELVEELRVDIFSTNAGYRGTDFQDLWTGDRTPGFSGFSTLSRTYNKPVFIAELGWHQLNSQVNLQIPDWFNQLYKDLILHTDEGTVGGAFFEYNDEPYKDDPLQQTMGAVEFTVSEVNGRKSTDPNAWNPDNVVRKQNIFKAIKEGEFEGKPYNFNADVWELLGRERTTLPSDMCQPSNTPEPTGPSKTTAPGPSDMDGINAGQVITATTALVVLAITAALLRF